MTPEDRLRAAIAARTSHVEPLADALQTIQEKLMHTQRIDSRNRVLLGLGAAAAVIAVVVAAVVITRDDSGPVATDSTTTSTSTSTTEATSTTESTTTTEVPFVGVDQAVPVFPDPTTSQRFDDPVAVATAFAKDFIGYSDLVVGAFQQGDSRSGEVEIRSFAAGAPTVVLVRQLEDDTWFVIGSTTDSIQLATPAAGAMLTSPQPLVGKAYAFEGVVNVRLYVDGTQAPIAETTVLGRGDGVLGDFSGEVTFTNDSGARYGVLVLSEASARDGAAVQASVIRVAL